MIQKLSDFLNTKPLYYDKIDLSRMPRAFAMVEPHIRLGRVVHIVGTNGKGSTGRMLATMLCRDGCRVGHYSSPHIISFNERVWIDGADADDESLENAHGKLMKWLSGGMAESLSYFEYTTLLALVVFEGCDYIVLEAGLGGEFDATNVVPKELSVVTPIGLDHQAFLGETIEEIAVTKLRSIGKRALLASQPHTCVYEIAKRIAAEKGASLFRTEKFVKKDLRREIESVGSKAGWPSYLVENAVTAAAAYALATEKEPPVASLAGLKLKGRFERIAPNVVLDVGHNAMGAQAVARALDGERRILVYNALSDKNVEEILTILKPVVEHIEIIDIDNERAMKRDELLSIARGLGLETAPFRGVSASGKYLVFGSFVVAEAFLKRHKEKR